MKFSAADIRSAIAKIFAENPDAQVVDHDLDTLVVKVTGSTTDRPATADVGGIAMPIRYEKSDMAELTNRHNEVP